MDTLPLSIANGWASGISAYGVPLMAGLLGRVFVGVLLAIEFVADKIP